MPTPMKVLADRICAAHDRVERGAQEWIEGIIELASAMREVGERFSDHRPFGHWDRRERSQLLQRQ
jgi:hypothetical protein